MINYAKFLGSFKNFEQISMKAEIMIFQDSIIKDKADDPDERWMRT